MFDATTMATVASSSQSIYVPQAISFINVTTPYFLIVTTKLSAAYSLSLSPVSIANLPVQVAESDPRKTLFARVSGVTFENWILLFDYHG